MNDGPTNDKRGWRCPGCRRFISPYVAECPRCIEAPTPAPTVTLAPKPRFNPAMCPCNPARGGSGVCGCILGGPQVTC